MTAERQADRETSSSLTSSESMESIWKRLEITPGSRVLDIGFGNPEELLEISRLVGGRSIVYGVDVNKQSAKRALEQLHQAKSIRVLECDSSKIPLPDGSAELVLLKGVLHEVGNILETLREARRLCTDTGKVLILDFSRFPKAWLRKSNLKWRIRHPTELFSRPLDKHPGFTREEILFHIESVGLKAQGYEDNFAAGRFSGHPVPMFLAVAVKHLTTTR